MRNIMIASYRFSREGEQARGHLADAGIDSLLHSADVGARPLTVVDDRIRLFVRAEDADRARTLLDNADDIQFS